ncbi:MAG: hypothetical protein LW878_11995 [Proteobacteria bacterium]|jgi:hypothetical protein|nr:hypothetical protein [Pseudomonadota bacterium]
MRSLLLLLLLASCAQFSRPQGGESFYAGSATEYDAKTNEVIREAEILLDTVVQNQGEKIHAWFYTGPSKGVKLDVFPSISTRTENPLVYVMTHRDGSYLGKHFFYSEKRDKWRVELYFVNGDVNIIDYVAHNGEMEFTQNITRADGSPVMRVLGKLKVTDKAEFAKRREALTQAK